VWSIVGVVFDLKAICVRSSAFEIDRIAIDREVFNRLQITTLKSHSAGVEAMEARAG
jgi:hypothetical protein